MKRKLRLIVRPDAATAISQIFGGVMLAALLMATAHPYLSLVKSCLLFLLPLCPWIIYVVLRQRNKRIFVFDWGMVFCSILGTMTKVKYPQLTSVRISTGWRHVIYVEFYAEDTCVASCCSRDDNYSQLMKYLSTQIPEKLEWTPGMY